MKFVCFPCSQLPESASAEVAVSSPQIEAPPLPEADAGKSVLLC